jgi:hypothetical protein
LASCTNFIDPLQGREELLNTHAQQSQAIADHLPFLAVRFRSGIEIVEVLQVFLKIAYRLLHLLKALSDVAFFGLVERGGAARFWGGEGGEEGFEAVVEQSEAVLNAEETSAHFFNWGVSIGEATDSAVVLWKNRVRLCVGEISAYMYSGEVRFREVTDIAPGFFNRGVKRFGLRIGR